KIDQMDPTYVLLAAFLISILALGIFIWSMRKGALHDSSGAKVIFGANEIGRTEDPAAASHSRTALQRTVDLRQGRHQQYLRRSLRHEPRRTVGVRQLLSYSSVARSGGFCSVPAPVSSHPSNRGTCQVSLEEDHF